MTLRRLWVQARGAGSTLAVALLAWGLLGGVVRGARVTEPAFRDDAKPYGSVTVRVSPASQQVAEQRELWVDVYLDAGTLPVDAVDCIMRYDGAYLYGIALWPGSALPQSLTDNHIGGGEVAYHRSVVTGSPAVTGTFKLFRAEFYAQRPSPSTTLHLELAFVAGSGEGHAVIKQDGQVTILAVVPRMYLPLTTRR